MKIKRIDHIGIVLTDYTPFKRILENIFYLNTTLEVPYEDDCHICFLPAGDTDIELCSPINRNGPTARDIEAKGHHVEHIAFEVEDIHAAVKELKNNQIPLLENEPIPGARGNTIINLDPKATSGIKIELVQYDRKTSK